MPGLIAEEKMRFHGIAKFTPDVVHEMVLASTGNQELADEIAAELQQRTYDEMDRSGAGGM